MDGDWEHLKTFEGRVFVSHGDILLRLDCGNDGEDFVPAPICPRG